MTTQKLCQNDLIFFFTKKFNEILNAKNKIKTIDIPWNEIENKGVLYEAVVNSFNLKFSQITFSRSETAPSDLNQGEFLSNPKLEISLHNFLILLYNLLLAAPEDVSEGTLKIWRENFNSKLSLFSSRKDFLVYINSINKIIDKEKSPDFSFLSSQDSPEMPTDGISLYRSLPHSKVNSEIPTIIQKFDNHKINKCKTNTTLSSLDQLSCPKFEYEDEYEKINIVYSKGQIEQINIDLLIKKVAIGENAAQLTNEFLFHFIEQSIGFIKIEILINKILNAFKYFLMAQKKIISSSLIRFLSLVFEYIISYDIPITKQTKRKAVNFINETLRPLKEISEETKLNLSNQVNEIKEKVIQEKLVKKPSSEAANPISKFLILDEKKEESKIARKITSITNKMVKKISPVELLPKARNNGKLACNLISLISRSNNLTLFIIEEVLAYDHSATRARVVEKFICVAEHLYEMRNFNDLLSVVCAIGHSIIQHNLGLTWKKVKKSFKDKFEELKQFLSFEDNYKTMREEMTACSKAGKFFTPYIGIFLRRLSFLEEKIAYKNSKMINLKKIEIVSKEIYQFITLKNFLQEIDEEGLESLEVFEQLNPKKESELLILSKLIEPEFQLYQTKTNEKRRTKTDYAVYYNVIKK